MECIFPKYYKRQVLVNSVDPDQTALKEEFDQGLHCLTFCQHFQHLIRIVNLICLLHESFFCLYAVKLLLRNTYFLHKKLKYMSIKMVNYTTIYSSAPSCSKHC